jgi:hypothetical protein
MSTLVVSPVRLSRRRVMLPHREPSRLVAAFKLIRDVFVETRHMAMNAMRRYPYFE